MGSGSVSVGIAVASDTRDPWLRIPAKCYDEHIYF